jgi:hypothetical protein
MVPLREMEFSSVSWGGYTWGIALPENALTVDSYDYIGLIVSFSDTCYKVIGYSTETMNRLALFLMVQDGLACFMARKRALLCLIISCF